MRWTLHTYSYIYLSSVFFLINNNCIFPILLFYVHFFTLEKDTIGALIIFWKPINLTRLLMVLYVNSLLWDKSTPLNYCSDLSKTIWGPLATSLSTYHVLIYTFLFSCKYSHQPWKILTYRADQRINSQVEVVFIGAFYIHM